MNEYRCDDSGEMVRWIDVDVLIHQSEDMRGDTATCHLADDDDDDDDDSDGDGDGDGDDDGDDSS